MDTLSATLATTRLQSSLLATLSLSAPWSIDFMFGSGAPVHYVIEGEAWVETDLGPPVRLAAGDLVMFPRWDRHVLCSSPGETPDTILDVVRKAGATPWTPGELLDRPTRVVWGRGGDRTELLSMNFRLESPEQSPLLLGLPRFMHIRIGDARMTNWLQPVLEFIADETNAQRPGYAVVSSRLADLLFMQIVRAQVLLRPRELSGWLSGLSDPALARALAAMSERPAHRWTVAELGRVAGLSRSSFAARFSAIVGVTPLDYLIRQRMQIAAEQLSRGVSVKTVAGELGYATTFAFTKAFKRIFGDTPGRYSRTRHPVLD